MSKILRLVFTGLIMLYRTKVSHSINSPPSASASVTIVKKPVNKIFNLFFEEVKTIDTITKEDVEDFILETLATKKRILRDIADDKVYALRANYKDKARSLLITDSQIIYLRLKCDIACNKIDIKMYQDEVNLETKALNSINEVYSEGWTVNKLESEQT